MYCGTRNEQISGFEFELLNAIAELPHTYAIATAHINNIYYIYICNNRLTVFIFTHTISIPLSPGCMGVHASE